MNLNKITAVFAFVALVTVNTHIGFAADEVTAAAENPVVSPADATASASIPQAQLESENDTQWIWGEVVNLDAAGKTITLKYLDYETDQEKDIVLSVDEKTTFENIKSFDEIKVKDTLSIDYTVAPDGKNIAKNIGLESPDSSAAAPAQTVEDTNQVDAQAASEQPAAKSDVVVEQVLPAAETAEPVTQK
jgi:hypothetical protein